MSLTERVANPVTRSRRSLIYMSSMALTSWFFKGIVNRFEEAEFARGFLILAFRVSDLRVGGYRVERGDEGYARAE